MDFTTFTVMLLVVFLLVLNGFALWWIGYLLLPFLKFGAPYVPTSRSRVDLMIQKARLTPSDRVVDLGSGDGRILFAAAEKGVAKAVGFEIHSGLVKASRLTAKTKGLTENVEIHKRSFWNEPMNEFSVVFMFQIPFALKRLSKKLRSELAPGSRVISNGYQIPDLRLINDDHQIYLYEI